MAPESTAPGVIQVAHDDGGVTRAQWVGELKADVAKRCGSVDSRAWSQLENSSAFDEALRDRQNGASRDDVARWLLEDYPEIAAAGAHGLPERKSDRDLMNRRWARRLIAAGPPEQQEAVLAFRRQVLRGRLISPTNVANWIRKRVKESSQLPQIEPPSPTPPGWKITSEPLEYLDPEKHDWICLASARFEPLSRLKTVARAIARTYGWEESFAVHFVLSGLMPPPHERRPWKPTEPGLAPTRRQAELAVFVAGRNDGRTWADLALEYNDTHPDSKYREWRNLARDAKRDYALVTGEPLRWRNADEPESFGPLDEAKEFLRAAEKDLI